MHQKLTISPQAQNIYTVLSVSAGVELLLQNQSSNIKVYIWDGTAGTTKDTASHILYPEQAEVFSGTQLLMWTKGGDALVQPQLAV